MHVVFIYIVLMFYSLFHYNVWLMVDVFSLSCVH